MKILSATVDWYKDWANTPRFNVVVDKLPKRKDMVFTKRNGLYFAEKDGYVEYFYYTEPGNGFGGSVVELNMADGTTEKLIGPWSSRASCANMEGFYPCTEVYIREEYLYGGNLTIDRLFECAELANVYLVLEVLSYGRSWDTLLSGEQADVAFQNNRESLAVTRENWKDLITPLVGKYEFRFNPSVHPDRLEKP